MTERWWAPQRATVEPDAVVLAMLEPGDFGAAILATHRAGAAAIETVSKGALPTEERLTSAMAAARANLANAVVDVVAKSVQTPTYAALLMRDVFDDAETAAVGLYRAAVAKGVTPPVAAQRAGLVYGVPAHELGKYHALATDPKTSPAAITDAADRVLMTYVSKLAAQEVVGQQTEVAKTGVAPDQPRHHHVEPTVSAGWREWLHPRDAEGQFARRHTTSNPPVMEMDAEPKPVQPRVGSNEWLRQQLGMAQRPGAPTRVADIETPTKPAEPRQARQRQVKRVKQVRTVRPQQAAEGKQAEGRLAAQRQVDTRVAARRQAEALTAASRLAQKINPSLPQAQPGTDLVPTTNAPDFLKRYPGGPEWSYELEDPFTFMLTQRDAIDFRTKLANQTQNMRDKAARVFRLGYLQDLASGRGDIATSKEAGGTRKGVAEDEQAKVPNYVAPTQKLVHPHDMLRDEEHARMYLQQRREEQAQRRVIDESGFPKTVTDHDELQWVHAMPVYRPFGMNDYLEEGQSPAPEWAIVHFLPDNDQQPHARSIPMIDEFVIPFGAMGTEDSTKYGQAVELDPNQAYEVVAPPGSRQGARISPVIMWDPVNEVVVNRWFIRPVSEDEVSDMMGDVGKADRPAQHRVFHEYDVVRDLQGRFAEEPSTAPAPTTGHLPSRRTKQVRRVRTVRTVRQARPQQAQQATAQRQAAARQAGQSQMTARQRTVARAINRVATQRIAAAQQHEHEHRELPILDDRARYHVLTDAQWDSLQKDLLRTRDGSFRVGASAARALQRKSTLNGEAVVAELNLNVEEAINAAEGPAQTQYEWNRRPAGRGPMRSEADDFAMARHIDQIFARFPDIAQIHIDYVSHPGEYVLYANRKPVSPQVIVELDDDLDMSQPLELVPLGDTFRSTEMVRRRSDIEGNPLMPIIGDDPNPVNATMEQFRLQNAKVQRYRLSNG